MSQEFGETPQSRHCRLVKLSGALTQPEEASTHADQMALIGEETTNVSVHWVEAILSTLDRKLF